VKQSVVATRSGHPRPAPVSCLIRPIACILSPHKQIICA